MNDENNTIKEDGHYVCRGGCGGVSTTPGTCQAEDCQAYGLPLEDCACEDGEHKN